MIVKGTKFRVWRQEGAAFKETLKELMLKLRSVSGLSYLKAQIMAGIRGGGLGLGARNTTGIVFLEYQECIE